MQPSSSRRSFVVSGVMCVAAGGSYALRPSAKAADVKSNVDLETLIPKQFAGWQVDTRIATAVVNPQTQQLLDKLYNQVLSRTYVDASGRRVMLSLAYGGDQRGLLEAHKPEVCYPAQGFKLLQTVDGPLATRYGSIAVRRLDTSLGPRREPVTYWFTVGDSTVQNRWEKRLVEIRLSLTGQIPDGMLFRVSSIDPDPQQGWDLQGRFVEALMDAVQPRDRTRLAGLRA